MTFPRVHIRYIFSLLTLSASLANTSLLNAAPASGPLTGGILVGDLSLDKVLITKDLDGNGDADGEDEAPVYFDETNLSGIPEPTGGVFTLHQARSGYQYIGNGNTDAVYRLDDANHDGDANDEGEAILWFSETDNASAFTLPTPNGIFETEDGAVYIVNAGVGSRPTDAVYRTEDLNEDGDANDAGEATLWLDLGILASELTGANPNKSSAFDISFIGQTAYIADTMGGEADTIFRANDRNNNGVIDTGELSVFIDDLNEFGVPVATGLTVLGNDLYVSESSSSAFQTLFRLRDKNNNGTIDDASEALEIWNESQVPVGVELGTSFGLTISFEGQVYLTSAGSDIKDNIFRLIDLDSDGRYLSEGETILWRSGNDRDVPVDFARSLASMHDFLAAQDYYAVSQVNFHNDLPRDIADIADLLSTVESGGRPDYDAIRVIYAEGKNSVKPNGSFLTLKGFADGVDSKDPNKNFEMIFTQAVNYFGQPNFLDAYLSNAIDGTGQFTMASDEQRAAAIEAGLRSVLSYWVRFELRFSAVKAFADDFTCPKGAPHNWDEGFAFYYGPKGKHSLYAFANKLSLEFELNKPINQALLKSFRTGLDHLVPNRPMPGQTECDIASWEAKYPKRQQSLIEKQFLRTFLLAILQNAETMIAGESQQGAQSAQSSANAHYLAIAPEVKKVAPRADRRLTRLLEQQANQGTGRHIKRTILSRFHNLLKQ